MKRYNITILGETIPIVSDEGDAYIAALTDHIEEIIRDLSRKGTPGLNPASKLLFASIILADELYKTRAELEEFMKAFEGESGAAPKGKGGANVNKKG